MEELPTPELRSGPPWAMEEMIAAEPGLAAPILGDRDSAARLAALLGPVARGEAGLSIVGCGTSEHAAMAVAALVDEALGERAGRGAVVARQAFEAALDPWPDNVVLGISHEASTPATTAALRVARNAGSRTLLVTAHAGGPANAVADERFVTPLLDRSWCHTVGYLSPILAGAAISGALAGRTPDAGPLAALLDATLELGDQAALVAAGLRDTDRIVVCGSGIDAIGARELALKMEEGVQRPAVGRDVETQLHGHLVSCDARTGLIVLLTDPRAATLRAARADQLLRAARRLGVRTAAIVTQPAGHLLSADATSVGRITLPAATGVLPLLAAIAGSAIALQLLTVGLVLAAGTNPDLIGRERTAHRESAAIASASFPLD